MKKIRQSLKQNRNVDKSHLYISSYWRKGLQEEEHKVVKKDDAQVMAGGVIGNLKKLISN